MQLILETESATDSLLTKMAAIDPGFEKSKSMIEDISIGNKENINEHVNDINLDSNDDSCNKSISHAESFPNSPEEAITDAASIISTKNSIANVLHEEESNERAVIAEMPSICKGNDQSQTENLRKENGLTEEPSPIKEVADVLLANNHNIFETNTSEADVNDNITVEESTKALNNDVIDDSDHKNIDHNKCQNSVINFENGDTEMLTQNDETSNSSINESHEIVSKNMNMMEDLTCKKINPNYGSNEDVFKNNKDEVVENIDEDKLLGEESEKEDTIEIDSINSSVPCKSNTLDSEHNNSSIAEDEDDIIYFSADKSNPPDFGIDDSEITENIKENNSREKLAGMDEANEDAIIKENSLIGLNTMETCELDDQATNGSENNTHDLVSEESISIEACNSGTIKTSENNVNENIEDGCLVPENKSQETNVLKTCEFDDKTIEIDDHEVHNQMEELKSDQETNNDITEANINSDIQNIEVDTEGLEQDMDTSHDTNLLKTCENDSARAGDNEIHDLTIEESNLMESTVDAIDGSKSLNSNNMISKKQEVLTNASEEGNDVLRIETNNFSEIKSSPDQCDNTTSSSSQNLFDTAYESCKKDIDSGEINKTNQSHNIPRKEEHQTIGNDCSDSSTLVTLVPTDEDIENAVVTRNIDDSSGIKPSILSEVVETQLDTPLDNDTDVIVIDDNMKLLVSVDVEMVETRDENCDGTKPAIINLEAEDTGVSDRSEIESFDLLLSDNSNDSDNNMQKEQSIIKALIRESDESEDEEIIQHTASPACKDDVMVVDEINDNIENVKEKNHEIVPLTQVQKEPEKFPSSGLCRLSNTLDILSDEEDEVPKSSTQDLQRDNAQSNLNASEDKQLVNVDDDDVMVIDEDLNNKNISDPDLEVSKPDESSITCDKDSSTNEINKENSGEAKLKGLILNQEFIKSSKERFAEMTREELEEFCIMKIVDGIYDKSNYCGIKQKLKTMSETFEVYNTKIRKLIKQNQSLKVILKSIQEQQANSNAPIVPIKTTRSVGLQVIIADNAEQKPSLPPSPTVPSLTPIPANNTTKTRSSVNRNSKDNKQVNSIPVPRLVPANSAATTTSANLNLNIIVNSGKVVDSSAMGPPPPPLAIKLPMKRPLNKTQQDISVENKSSPVTTVDLTDDEPPTKVNPRSHAAPVRCVPPQNLLAPPKKHASQIVPSPKKVYIPISPQPATNAKSGPTYMVKAGPPSGLRHRGPVPNSIRMAQNQLKITRVPRHPAPLPDVVKQYQPPNWKVLPPAPSLKLSKKDDSIVISWTIEGRHEETYEEIASYQIYAYHETSAPPSTALWKKIGDVKALPLPMACTLTKFSTGFIYYFAVRAVDIRSRLGPFSFPGKIYLMNS